MKLDRDGWREFDIEQAILQLHIDKVKKGDRQGVTVREISRELGCSQRSVRKFAGRSSRLYVTKRPGGKYVPTVKAMDEGLELGL